MRVVFMGTPDFATVILKRILERGHELVGVFCQPDKPKGRDLEPSPPSVKVCAMNFAHGAPVFQPGRIGEKSLSWLRSLSPDLVVVAAYGKMLSKAFLDVPRYGCVNVHASLLPSYRGAAPVQWAIARGEKITGVSIMKMDEGLDTGDVLAQSVVVIEPWDTGESLLGRVAEEGARLLADTMERMAQGEIIPVSQDHSIATYAPIIRRQDGELNFGWSGETVANRVRAFYPWPGAYTWFRSSMLKVFPYVDAIDLPPPYLPNGTIVTVDRDGMVVACGGSGCVRIHDVQLAGKKRMSAWDFSTGAHLRCGETLGRIDG